MSIVFIGGVHGVGKSTFCEHIAEHTGMRWLTASALIKTEKQSAITAGSKSVVDPIGNQELLLRGIHNYMRPDQGGVLLDGHFTLLNAAGEIVSIDTDVFFRLGLKRIIVLRDDDAAICIRLRERDGQDRSISETSAHQDAEIKQACEVATKLCIPVLLINPLNAKDFEKAVEFLLPR